MFLKAIIVCARCGWERDVIQFDSREGLVISSRAGQGPCPQCEDVGHLGKMTTAQIAKALRGIPAKQRTPENLAEFFFTLATNKLPELMEPFGPGQGQRMVDEIAEGTLGE